MTVRPSFVHCLASLCCAALLAGIAPLADAASAFKEKPGARDYPLISRFQGAILANYGVINFERVEVPVAADKKEAVEGKVFNYYYVAPKDRSDLEVFRSYRQALEASRFQLLFACEEPKRCAEQRLGEHAAFWTDQSTSFQGGYSPITRMDQNGNYPPRFLVARLSRAEGDVTAVLTVRAPSSTETGNEVGAPAFLQVIESMPMQTGNVTVTADALGAGLGADGRIALYGVFFDTGKAEIKPESKPQLDEMARYLTTHKTAKILVVGHTDNQGAVDANLALSQKRAEAVTAALSGAYKIDAKRLQARGVANFSPLASNASEAGRAKNRRVELVEP